MEEENDQGLPNAPDLNARSGDIFVQLTQIDIRYKTFLGSYVLFNAYKIKVYSKLLSIFKAFEEGNMNSLKDLVPIEHIYQ